MSSTSIISNSLLELDVKSIYNKSKIQNSISVNYSVVLHTPLLDIPIKILHFVEYVRDYDGSFGDSVRVKFTIDGDLYRRKVMSYENNLEMTIVKQRGKSPSYTVRYKCFINKSNFEENRGVIEDLTDDALKERYPAEVEVELCDIDLYNRMYNTSVGTYNNTTVESAIYSELSKLSPEVLKIDFVKPDNTNVYGTIDIPTGTKTLGVPTLLQNNNTHGIYNAGVGTYVQHIATKGKVDKYIFVYPLNDIKRFDNSEYRVMFMHSKDIKSGSGEYNHCLDGNILKVVPKYDYTYFDPGETSMSNSGDVIVSAIPDNVTKPSRDVREKTLIGDKKINVNVTAGKNKLDGNYSVNYVGVTNNLYKHRSDVISKTIATYDLLWEHSDIDLIYPGMGCQFIYEDKAGRLIKLSGQVKGCYEMYNHSTKESKAAIRISVMSPTLLIGTQYNKKMGIE